jgi:hypothetical protein
LEIEMRTKKYILLMIASVLFASACTLDGSIGVIATLFRRQLRQMRRWRWL